MAHSKKCRECGRYISARNANFCNRKCNRSWHNSNKNKRKLKKIAKRTGKHTVYKQKSDLDQFYTSEAIAKQCYSEILKLYNEADFDLFLEPSAGTGVFLKLFPESKRIGLDLEPKDGEIRKQDFFTYEAPSDGKKILTGGNPPFGRICSLAIKFFNKAAKFSTVIAFIIPKTFQKQSLQNKLDPFFQLKVNIDLPKNSFVFNGQPYDVPCCFQIWEKSDKGRTIKKVDLKNELFDFVKKKDANVAVRRVGGRAGKATSKIKNLSESCHYFLKLKLDSDVQKFIETINGIDFSKIINATAGVRSLSKPEFIQTLRSGAIIT